MEISTIKMFIKIAELKSFSKAATALDTAQSYISTRIHQYEKELGTELFIRHNKGVELTAYGLILLDYAKQILRLADEAENAVSQNSQKGLLRISTMQSTAQTYLPSILYEFHKKYPDYQLKISTSNAMKNLEKLFRFESDFSFAAGKSESDELCTIKLTEEKMVLVSMNRIESLKDYFENSNFSLIAFPSGCAYRKHTENWLSSQKINLKTVIECDSIAAILASTAAGMGVAVLPEHLVADKVREGVLFSHELPEKYRTIPLNLCYRKEMKLNEAGKSFIDLCKIMNSK
ncbi:MAG: LysR family transcriptional regulator [Succinivibrio sp.]|nr:LysR family transcriptional regulator [Succinivibrio sp.]